MMDQVAEGRYELAALTVCQDWLFRFRTSAMSLCEEGDKTHFFASTTPPIHELGSVDLPGGADPDRRWIQNKRPDLIFRIRISAENRDAVAYLSNAAGGDASDGPEMAAAGWFPYCMTRSEVRRDTSQRCPLAWLHYHCNATQLRTSSPG